MIMKKDMLLNLLEKLSPALARTDVVEQATFYAFKNGRVWSFNNEIAISCKLPDSARWLKGAVPAEPLLKLLRRLQEDDVQLDTTERELHLVAGSTKAGVVLEDAKLPVQDIPIPPPDKWATVPDGFAGAMQLAAKCADKKKTAGVLSNVHLTDKQVVGCNNFQLTVAAFQEKLEIDPILLEGTAALYVADFMPSSISQLPGWIYFASSDGTMLCCRTTAENYPDVSRLLHVEGTRVTLPQELFGILNRATALSDDAVSVSANETVIKISARSEFGWFEESTQLQENHNAFAFMVDPAVLSNALALHQTITVGKTALLMRGAGFRHVVALT